MASTLKSLALLAQKKSVLFSSTTYGRLASAQFYRQSHILHKENGEDKIVLADNGDTIVCWHPEKPFPYEHSLPLPAITSDVNQVLKATAEDVAEVFHERKPQMQREYLMKVTATTKHRWFPRKGVKFAKKNKPDREFL